MNGATALCNIGDQLCAGTCASDSDCNSHGTCTNAVCVCASGWLGGKCTQPQDCPIPSQSAGVHPDLEGPPADGTLGNCPVTLTHGSSCTVECNAGYTLTSGNSGAYQCNAGSATHDVVCTPNQCTITAPAQGDWGDCPDTRVLDHAQGCTFVCDAGYGLAQQPLCTAGNAGPALPCEPLACPTIAAPTYSTSVAHTAGLNTCTNGIDHLGSCVLVCNSGYYQSGTQPTCEFGVVTQTLTCNPVPCTRFNLPDFATRGNCAASFNHGSSCALDCEAGYTISNPNVLCDAGSVDVRLASCVPNNCVAGLNVAPTDGTLGFPSDCPNDGSLTHAQSCDLACDTGYTLIGDRPQCFAGTITSTVSCVPSDCTRIAAPGLNGGFGDCNTDGTLLHNATCALTCNSGYTAVGAQPECDYGVLTSDVTCVPDGCTEMQLPANAVWGDCRSNGTMAHGTMCGLQCSPGYTRSGEQALCAAGIIFNANSGTPFDGIVCIEDIDCVGKWASCDTTCSAKTFAILTPRQGSGNDCQALDGSTTACEPFDTPWFTDSQGAACTAWEGIDCTNVTAAVERGYAAGDVADVQLACERSCAVFVGFRPDGLCTDNCWCDHDCNGQGTCDDTTRRCVCTNDYWGLHCQKAPIPCSGCGDHGTCPGTLLADVCTCTGGYTGPTCKIDPCGGCGSQGACLSGTTCTCSDGYTGSSCETPPDVDCVGQMTACGLDCAPQVFVVAVEQSGTGAPCQSLVRDTLPCSGGMGLCPPDIDCVGIWSNCTALCEQSVFNVTRNATGNGAPCEALDRARRSCAPGEGECPLDTACAGAWSLCEPTCADAQFSIAVNQSGQAQHCEATHLAASACKLGNGQCGLFSSPRDTRDICFAVDGQDRGPAKAWSTYRDTALGGYAVETQRVDTLPGCGTVYNTTVPGQCPGIWDLNSSSVQSWDCTVPCARQLLVFNGGCAATFFMEMRRQMAHEARVSKHTFLRQATSYADEGNGLALDGLEVQVFVEQLRLRYTEDFARVSDTQAAIVQVCDRVAIPRPVNVTLMYPDLPFYEDLVSMIHRARGGPPEVDRLANCQSRLFEAIPQVCLGIDSIASPGFTSSWTCSKSCASQWIDGLEYCKTTSIDKFHTPVALAAAAGLRQKVTEWEHYAALGAVSQSEPDLHGVVPVDDHNLERQEIRAWYARWWLDFKGVVMDLDGTLSTMKGQCAQTVNRAAELRVAALAAPPVTDGPTAMVATSTIQGPAVNPAAMMEQLELLHGAGNAVIKSFIQEVSIGMSLPGTPADFDAATPKGQAARYMIRQGTAVPLGALEQNITIDGIGASGAGRRRLQAAASGVQINATVASTEDVSNLLTGANSNFSSGFTQAYSAAASTVPEAIANTVSFTDMALLTASANSLNDQQAAITLNADIATIYPDNDAAAQAAFRETAANDIAQLCGVTSTRVVIDAVVSGSAIIRFTLIDAASTVGAASAASALQSLASQVSSGSLPSVAGLALGIGAFEVLSTGGIQVTPPTYTTHIEIEVSVPPGMLPDDAAELVDQNAILGMLFSAGVDLSEVTITASVEQVLPVVEMIVEVQVTLDVTIEEVQADRPAFEASFKSSTATELGVAQSAIVITAITSGSVVVSFTVDGLAKAAITAALTGATLGGYTVASVIADEDLTDAVDASDVVGNAISADELAGLGGGAGGAKKLAAATYDIDFGLGVGVGVGGIVLIGLYIMFFTIGRHRSKMWAEQMSQVVPTGPGAIKAKAALQDMRKQMDADRKMTPPKSITPNMEEGLGLTRTQMLLANLTQEQIQTVQETFEMFDDDNSGAIDASEMRAAMKALGQDYTKKECKAMISELDEDGDGDLDIDEFLVLMAPMLLKMEDEGTVMTKDDLDKVKAAFQKFDTDGSGEIDAVELCAAMRKLGHKMNIEQCEQAIASVDEDESGEIDLNEFIVLMAPIIIEEGYAKIVAQVEAQKMEEEAKAAAIAARKEQAAQDLMDARLRDGYGAGGGICGDTPHAPDGKPGGGRRRKKDAHRKHRKHSDASSMGGSNAGRRRGYDSDEGVRGAEAPRPLPRPPKTRKHAKGMGGSKRSRMQSDKIETDKNWRLTDSERQGLHVEHGSNSIAAHIR